MLLIPPVTSRATRALVAVGLFTSVFLGQAALAPIASAHELGSLSDAALLDSAPAGTNPNQPPLTAANVPAAQTNATSSAPASALGSAVPPDVKRWEPLILKYSQQYGVDPNLVAAIMESESQGDPNATSPVGAAGLMQVMGGSYDPETNVHQGVALLSSLTQQFGSDLEKVIAAYNAGDAVVSSYNGIPPYQETQMYVFSVLNRYYLYVSG